MCLFAKKIESSLPVVKEVFDHYLASLPVMLLGSVSSVQFEPDGTEPPGPAD